MIKIIKPGKKIFNGQCDRCGCEFSYEFEDLFRGVCPEFVRCPECEEKYFHPSQFGKKNLDLQPPFGTQGDCISNDMLNCLQGNHEWECIGIFSGGSNYRCTKCGKLECRLYKSKEYTISLDNSTSAQNIELVNNGVLPQLNNSSEFEDGRDK